MTRTVVITYDGLPISSGGAHTLRSKGFVAGLESIRSFVEAVSADTTPVDLAVEVLSGEEVPAAFSSRLITEFDSRFARALERGIGSYTGRQWNVDANELDPLAHELSSISPLPQAGYAGPSVVLHATWRLVLLDPATNEPLPFQGKEHYLGFASGFEQYLGESVIYARISTKTTASLFLSLPFEDEAAAKQYVSEVVQPEFPTRLSSKHWKKWRLTKAGTSYVGRKCQVV